VFTVRPSTPLNGKPAMITPSALAPTAPATGFDSSVLASVDIDLGDF
jgi:hypothetical protein